MLAAFALIAATAAPSDKLDALLPRIAQAYGGEKALAQPRTLRETGTLQTMRGLAKTVRIFAPPDHLRIEIVYPDGSGETRVLANGQGFRNGERVEGPPRDAMVLQAARLDLPGLLFRNRAKLVDLGPVKGGHGIGVPLSGYLNLAVTVDPRSGRIVRSEGALPGGPGGQIRFATDYRDFKAVQGLLFAFTEENFASGQHTGETRLTQIELLPEPPRGAFAP